MKKALFERNNRTIKTLRTRKRNPYGSINMAKRFSHKVQMEQDGALGRGTVRVVD